MILLLVKISVIFCWSAHCTMLSVIGTVPYFLLCLPVWDLSLHHPFVFVLCSLHLISPCLPIVSTICSSCVLIFCPMLFLGVLHTLSSHRLVMCSTSPGSLLHFSRTSRLTFLSFHFCCVCFSHWMPVSLPGTIYSPFGLGALSHGSTSPM